MKMVKIMRSCTDSVQNPIDRVEDVLDGYNWVYNRTNNQELIVEVAGRSCNYRMLFIWQEHMSALQLCCEYDLEIKQGNMDATAHALMDINPSMWMGHFEVSKKSGAPAFRHTCMLYKHPDEKDSFQIEDLVDICLIQCERYQPVFHLLATNTRIDSEVLSFAMMETAGES